MGDDGDDNPDNGFILVFIRRIDHLPTHAVGIQVGADGEPLSTSFNHGDNPRGMPNYFLSSASSLLPPTVRHSDLTK
jgi:hypothetical protein